MTSRHSVGRLEGILRSFPNNTRSLRTSAPLFRDPSGSNTQPNPFDPFRSTTTNAQESTTHFGFKSIPESLKEKLVGGVFSSVASSYDVMNDAMSLGIHRLWKDHFVKRMNPREGWNCLDVAGGTGDIALRILDHARLNRSDRSLHVKLVDINADMLKEGERKFAETIYHSTPQVSFQVGNAENLEGVPSDSQDMYTIAFGIRNCTHVDRVLAEAYRVLKPGGVFGCLEFSKVENPVLAQLYRSYSFNIIPNLGHIIASDRDSYQYLVESIERFPSQQRFANMIENAGFNLVPHSRSRNTPPWENLTFGVVAIHVGQKPIA
ncbi:UbiE/COQ5 methyltransferase [Atractiella rhizophila]|nr:UbiE/COQ5 methyltransferase [Atractiella rhizophila]